MKIAVVGAGLYGVLADLEFSKLKGNKVELFDQLGLLRGASSNNQFRIHRGYHYPRSRQTVEEVESANDLFVSLFSRAIIKPSKSLYAVARHDTKTSPDEFEEFCYSVGLPIKVKKINWINYEKIARAFEVEETLYDPMVIKDLLEEKLRRSSVSFNVQRFKKEFVNSYDLVVYCTYGIGLDGKSFSSEREIQLVEKIKIKLPNLLTGKSLVIIDGPFTAFDPLPYDREFSQFGSAKFTKHDLQYNINQFDADKLSMVHLDRFKCVSYSNFELMKEQAAQYVPLVDKAKYHGSKFAFRVVENNKLTDERLVEIKKVSGNEIAVLAGKIVSSVQVGQKLHEYCSSL